jgi:23S rRNA pseudouridine2604 synthase
MVNKILRAGNHHEKEYLVTVNKPVTDEFIRSMSSGVPILGVMTRKCVVTKESTFVFRIILIQGMNRQIRRMCEYFGYEVTKLERTRIMNISLKGLPLGEWRELTEQELSGIFKLIKGSKSTEEEAKPAAKKKNRPAEEEVQPKGLHAKSSRPSKSTHERSSKKTGKSSNAGPKNKAKQSSGNKPGKGRPSKGRPSRH